MNDAYATSCKIQKGNPTSARRKKRKISGGALAAKILIGAFLVFFSLSIVIPFWMIFIKSFMTDTDIMFHPLALWPSAFQFDGYKTVFVNKLYNLGRAFLNSVYLTLAGTVYQLIITAFTAYALSRKNLPGKKIFMAYFLFTMYFGGGMIPYYITIKNLGLKDTLEVMYIPAYMSMFNMLVMRSYFIGLPKELEEAAKIDGASDFRVFATIVLPLSKAILATIALFISVGLWNNWYTAMLFITTKDKRPLAYALQVIIEICRGTNSSTPDGGAVVVGRSIQYAAIVITIVPIMCVYPFLQKYFTSGVLIGSVKG